MWRGSGTARGQLSLERSAPDGVCAWELSAHLWSWLGIQRPWGAQGLSADGPGLPTTDHAATLRGTSYTPGGPAFLTTQVSEASSLPLLSHEAALAYCLAAGTNSPIEGRRERGFIQLTVQGCEPLRRQECEAAGHIHSHRQNELNTGAQLTSSITFWGPLTLSGRVKIISHRYAQRPISQVVLDSAELAVAIR